MKLKIKKSANWRYRNGYKDKCPPLPRETFHTQLQDMKCFQLNQGPWENRDGTRHVTQAHAPDIKCYMLNCKMTKTKSFIKEIDKIST